MLQGTGSDVGKSLLAAGLCRALKNRGYRVAPFKPQNMSNNAAITDDGGEIGRAQALQARAAGIPTSVDMNPVLLKPESDRGSQVVVQGRVTGVVRSADYKNFRAALMPRVMESYERLCAASDIVVVEGAGSSSEVNLREGDIANMGFALHAGVPVLLVADIDRGGAIASLVGAHALATEEERSITQGYIVNKFRGDEALFTPALDIIRAHTGLRSLGIMRWFDAARLLPAEDAVALERPADPFTSGADAGKIKICVLTLSRISNFDDFDPLAAEPGVELVFVKPGDAMPGDARLVIIPGTKSTIADLEFARAQGWDVDLVAHVRRGGHVLGICGGYQIMGREISDPDAVESDEPQTVPGLGLLDVDTVMEPEKVLRKFSATTDGGTVVAGYEIHAGRTAGPDAERPLLRLDGVPEGAVGSDGRCCGCYIHGLFTSDGYRRQFLGKISGHAWDEGDAPGYEDRVDRVLDDLAAAVERDLDVEEIMRIAGLGEGR